MVTGNFKLAIDSLKSSKWRSFLTMLGVVIGVVSVVTIVSIGEGVKKQITDQINRFGPDLITVRPGKPIARDESGQIASVTLSPDFGGSILSETDLSVISKTEHVKTAVPLAVISGTPSSDNRTLPSAQIFGTSHDLPQSLNQEIEFGEFFDDGTNKNVAVIGKRVAETVFEETVPIGRSIDIRGKSFVVVGIFEEFETISLAPSTDYNSAVFIPYSAAKKLVNDQIFIQQILVKPDDPQQTVAVSDDIRNRLMESRSGQDDFSVLQQDDNLAIASSILTLLTSLITGVAAISLIVGGIGIMNIMIVSVTERLQEIGVRKAIGATNHQILSQFMIESAAISVAGGFVGIIIAWLVNFILRVTTNLEPVISPAIMAIAVGVSLLVGLVFGVAPALKAARKDPIEALRRI